MSKSIIFDIIYDAAIPWTVTIVILMLCMVIAELFDIVIY